MTWPSGAAQPTFRALSMCSVLALGTVQTLTGCGSKSESNLDPKTHQQESKNSNMTDAGESDLSSTEAEFQLPDGVEIAGPSGPLEVEIGVPDEQELDFVSSSPGAAIPIGGIGQAGLTAKIAVRVRPNAGLLETATVEVVLTNVQKPEIRPGVNNNATLPVDLQCRDDGWCYPAIVRVEISHMNRLPELEGTIVSVDATITNPEDETQTGSAHSWGYFKNTN